MDIEVNWDGPYSWPGFERANNFQSIPKTPGVYLQTFEFKDGYLIYAAGITRRSIPTRLREHTRKYMNGEYTILNIDSAQQGVRNEIWHGWSYARSHRNEFEERKSIIIEAAYKQLTGFRIFIANAGTQPRIIERMEASIMLNLYQQPSPVCDIPDKGMQLAPRWDSEYPIILRNNCAAVLHGLPAFLKI